MVKFDDELMMETPLNVRGSFKGSSPLPPSEM